MMDMAAFEGWRATDELSLERKFSLKYDSYRRAGRR
jgi:hypothetical protein